MDEAGNIQMLNIVPKPYQRPHPPLFQAFSQSESTIRWCAREGIIPTLLVSELDAVRRFAEVMVEEAAAHGRTLALGEEIGVFRGVYMGRDRNAAREVAMRGLMEPGWPGWSPRLQLHRCLSLPRGRRQVPGPDAARVRGRRWSVSKKHFCLTGNADDLRRGWTC